MPDAAPDAKPMKLRYTGTCRRCGTVVEGGQRAVYLKSAKAIECPGCYDAAPPAVVTEASAAPVTEPEPLAFSDGVAGASAREEYQRRMARREQRVKERFPRAGGLLLKVFEEGQPTKAWKVGAGGEERLGGMFDGLAGPMLRVLHDRRIPRSRANIDHIVVCPNGVMVVDAKKYKGRIRLKVEGGFFSPAVRKLVVGGRDRTKLVDGVAKQVGHVTDALVDIPVPVQGLLCFLEGDWPLMGGAFSVGGVGVLWPRRLRKLLLADGPLNAGEIDAIQKCLTAAFPPA